MQRIYAHLASQYSDLLRLLRDAALPANPENDRSAFPDSWEAYCKAHSVEIYMDDYVPPEDDTPPCEAFYVRFMCEADE